MASLFISYSRKDIEVAKRLTGSFNGQGLDFWIDWEGIPPTVDWWKEIEKGIEEADVFLFLISPDSAKSRVCRQEIAHAAKNGKRLIPVVVRDIEANESPTELKPLNWIFLRTNDDFNSGLSKLITAIKTDYEWVQAHRQMQVKALEWERNNYENSLLLRGKELLNAELQLATNTSKEPYPTDLQREYVFKSKRATDRQRRTTTSIAIAVIIALAVLSVIAFVQAGLARSAEATAVSNQSTAEAASTLAFDNAATAQANANMALARQLAVQAQSIYATGNSKQLIAVLLAIRSMQMLPSFEATQILQMNPLAQPLADIVHEDMVLSVAFSIDSKYVLSGSADGTARLSEAASGTEIARMTHANYVFDVAFSPDGKYAVSASADNTARVWETATGKEIARMTHDSQVNCIAFSPDGKYIVSGSGPFFGTSLMNQAFGSGNEDNTARVWEAASGREIARMTHNSQVTAVSFSPDGKYVVSASADDTARVWEAATGKEVARMTHDGDVTSVAFSADGKYLVSGSVDNTARVWEASTGREIARMTHDDQVTSVAFSPDGKYVVSGSGLVIALGPVGTDRTARVWEAATGKEIARMTHDDYVISVAFSPDGRYVVSGSADGTARVWEADTGDEIARTTHNNIVIAVAFSPDGKYVASASTDTTARVWEAGTEKEFARMLHDGAVTSIAMSPDGKYVVSGSADNTARVWEAATGKEIARMTHEDGVTSVTFSPDGRYVMSGGADDTARVWEAATGKEMVRMTHDNQVTSVAFSADGKYAASGNCDEIQFLTSGCTKGSAHIWEAATGKEIAHMTYEGVVLSLAFSPDSKYMVAGGCAKVVEIGGCTQGTARVWETATGKEIASMTHDGEVYTVTFSVDGKYVVSGSADGIIRVWESMTGKEITHMAHDNSVFDVDLSSDGKYLVSAGSVDRTVRVWEMATGQEIARMVHEDIVYSVAFSPDDKYVVSGSADGTARVWEAATGKEIFHITHDGIVTSVDFTSDGKYVVTASDNTVRVWVWQPADLIAKACMSVSRNLTRDEWKEYIGDTLPYQAICPRLPIEPEATPSAIP